MKTRNSIRAEINALYKNKVIGWLSDSIKSKTPAEPVRIYLGAPTIDEQVISNKDEFIRFCADWHKELTAGKVDFIEKTYPDIGVIEVPIHLVFNKIDEIATWAGHLVEYHSAEIRLKQIQIELPDLIDSAVENIHLLTTLDDSDFMRFVYVCRWLCKNKNSGALIRQIPVRGVDTEWFESHRFIILSFLGKYLDLNPMRRDVLQLGLVPPSQVLRVVFLDNVLRSKVGGIRDLGISIKDLSKLDIKPRKVLFFDDLATALSIPDMPGVVVIVLPSNIAEVCSIPWVSHSQCTYVSGVEMRSFAVINNIRVHLPNTDTLFLNKDCFAANKDLLSFDDIEIQELNSSMALTLNESMLYNMIAAGVFGRKARLPQERIPLNQIYDLLGIEYEVFPEQKVEKPASLNQNGLNSVKTESTNSEETKVTTTQQVTDKASVSINQETEIVESTASFETLKSSENN